MEEGKEIIFIWLKCGTRTKRTQIKIVQYEKHDAYNKVHTFIAVESKQE